MRGLVLCATGMFCLAIQSANAASIVVNSAPVFVSSGDGFTEIAGTTTVAPGTSVMAKPGGSAVIVYDDGCRIPLEAGSVELVGSLGQGSVKDAPLEQSPCAAGVMLGGVVISTPFLLGAGALAAAGVAIGIAASQDNGSTSP